MKLGLITDIHEHAANLRAALERLKQENVDEVILLGDIAEAGLALDETGRAENICTSAQTPIGTVEFTAIRNTETAQWLPISTRVTVTPR